MVRVGSPYESRSNYFLCFDLGNSVCWPDTVLGAWQCWAGAFCLHLFGTGSFLADLST